MGQILIFIFGIVLGAAVVLVISLIRANKGVGGGEKKETLIERQAREKEENKERIWGLLETNTPLTNNHIEQMLGIPESTATRYLDELEKEGKVRQVGKTGKYVFYERI